jgi:hypothetical protein
MAPLVNRLIAAVLPEPRELNRCLVCHGEIEDGDESMRVNGGGHVHLDCATYRMRHRSRAARRPSPQGQDRFTGD